MKDFQRIKNSIIITTAAVARTTIIVAITASELAAIIRHKSTDSKKERSIAKENGSYFPKETN
jgi:hypothetical protein